MRLRPHERWQVEWDIEERKMGKIRNPKNLAGKIPWKYRISSYSSP